MKTFKNIFVWLNICYNLKIYILRETYIVLNGSFVVKSTFVLNHIKTLYKNWDTFLGLITIDFV